MTHLDFVALGVAIGIGFIVAFCMIYEAVARYRKRREQAKWGVPGMTEEEETRRGELKRNYWEDKMIAALHLVLDNCPDERTRKEVRRILKRDDWDWYPAGLGGRPLIMGPIPEEWIKFIHAGEDREEETA